MLTMFIQTSAINLKEVTESMHILSLSRERRVSVLPNSLVFEHGHWVSTSLFLASIFIPHINNRISGSTYSINAN